MRTLIKYTYKRCYYRDDIAPPSWEISIGHFDYTSAPTFYTFSFGKFAEGHSYSFFYVAAEITKEYFNEKGFISTKTYSEGIFTTEFGTYACGFI